MTRNLDAVAVPLVATTTTVVDLEDLGLDPGESIHPPDNVGITSGGLNIDPGPTNQLRDIHVGNSIPFWSYNGTTVVVGHDDIVVSPAGGGTFSLVEFDFAGWPLNREVPFSVVANTGAMANFVPDGLADGQGGVVDFETFTLPGGFENISSATFIHTGPGTVQGLFHLDNIVVRGITPTTPAAEPADGPNTGAGVDLLDP